MDKMKTPQTRYLKLKNKLNKLQSAIYDMQRERDMKTIELENYEKRHKKIDFSMLETKDTQKLWKIYEYFDKRYPIDFQGGLRCDGRGMHLVFWLDKDPDYLILHLDSTSQNICFGGSTSWLVKAVSFDDKIKTLAQIKKDIEKIIK